MRIRALCGRPPIYVYLRGLPRACERLTANTSSTWVCTLRCPAPENVVFFTIPHINRIRLRRVFHAINTGVYYNTVRRTGVKYVYGANTGEFDYELPPSDIFIFFFLFSFSSSFFLRAIYGISLRVHEAVTIRSRL